MAGELADFASSARGLKMALQYGIPAALEQREPSASDLDAMVRCLEQQGMRDTKAREAVETWESAIRATGLRLHLVVEPQPAPAPATPLASEFAAPKPPESHRPPTPPPPRPQPRPSPDSTATPSPVEPTPWHKYAAIVSVVAVVADFLVGAALEKGAVNPLLLVFVIILAGLGASIQTKKSRFAAWFLCVIGCARTVTGTRVLLTPGLQMTGLLGVLVLSELVMAVLCFKAAIAPRTAASK